MNQERHVETKRDNADSKKREQRQASKSGTQSQSESGDRAGTSQGHDDPGSAPESGDKNP